MTRILALAAAAMLLSAGVDAQTERRGSEPPAPAGAASEQTRRSPGPPLDAGARTPEADRAHRGGGVVLEGAPGATAPSPQPTPPSGPAGQQIPRR